MSYIKLWNTVKKVNEDYIKYPNFDNFLFVWCDRVAKELDDFTDNNIDYSEWSNIIDSIWWVWISWLSQISEQNKILNTDWPIWYYWPTIKLTWIWFWTEAWWEYVQTTRIASKESFNWWEEVWLTIKHMFYTKISSFKYYWNLDVLCSVKFTYNLIATDWTITNIWDSWYIDLWQYTETSIWNILWFSVENSFTKVSANSWDRILLEIETKQNYSTKWHIYNTIDEFEIYLWSAWNQNDWCKESFIPIQITTK